MSRFAPPARHSVPGQYDELHGDPGNPGVERAQFDVEVDGHAPVMKTRELHRAKKGITQNAQTIESRIRYFQREEDKIWRDLDEVRRQAAKIEEGRTRALEKRVATTAINQVKEQALTQNRMRVNKQRQERMESSKSTITATQERRIGADHQRRESEEILRRKRLEEAQQRMTKSERVLAMQRETMEGKLRRNTEQQDRLRQIREDQERARIEAEQDVAAAESKLPELEAQEMACLQRLQNSRIVTQTVLQELEASLGSQSAVTTMLRTKHAQRASNLLGGSEVTHAQ